MYPTQNFLKVIHCLCLFSRSETESPPCPQRLRRRTLLHILSCCLTALGWTQRPHSECVLKAVADIIREASIPGTISSIADHRFHQWVETGLRFASPHSRQKLSAKGSQGNVARIFRHHTVKRQVRNCDSAQNSSVREIFAFFRYVSWRMLGWLREKGSNHNS